VPIAYLRGTDHMCRTLHFEGKLTDEAVNMQKSSALNG
jgi:hypothetical protein